MLRAESSNQSATRYVRPAQARLKGTLREAPDTILPESRYSISDNLPGIISVGKAELRLLDNYMADLIAILADSKED
jgi:hypothetical protein